MSLCKMFVWFIIYSFMGWLYESTFCTIRGHKWENRGFLHGPIVPIYGVGALLASMIFSELHIERLQNSSMLEIFIICFLGSIALEYFTSWALEKLFHAYWWDYSKEPLNINGRVCLFASIGFGVAGILVVRVIYPFVNSMTSGIPPLLMEFLALLFMLLFGVDLALTVFALTNFTQNFARIEKEINDQIAQSYDKLNSGVSNAIETMVEKKDAIQEGASLKMEQAEERMVQLREQLTAERLESLFISSSRAQKKTMLSIQGFKTNENTTAIRQRMRNLIEERKTKKNS